MATDGTATDKGIGLAIVFGALAAGSAALTLTAPGTEMGAYGFGGALLFGGLLVAALHIYE